MITDQLAEVQRLTRGSVMGSSLKSLAELLGPCLSGGKMLRSRLVLRLGGATGVPPDLGIRAAAAVELVHAASLLHDDVIDAGQIRRGQPAAWVKTGIKGAILLGDFLVCQAFTLVQRTGNRSLAEVLTESTREMCEAEAQQELLPQEHPSNWETCVRIARRKTGSLFGFAAYAGAGDSAPLAAVLREAGYAAGTAYQLADDVFDACGDPSLADKSVRRDEANGQLTAVSAAADGDDPARYVRELCDMARASLAEWPAVQRTWDAYMSEDMTPALDAFLQPSCAGASS